MSQSFETAQIINEFLEESNPTMEELRHALPPAHKTYLVNLPLCTLHVMEAGDGPPLIIVPATISELENWYALVQFMAQWFRVYFFELPGHGLSTPFAKPFSSDLVAETVGHFADSIGAQRFSLMGFSFGGILAMKTFKLLEPRVERIILNAPCVTNRALTTSPSNKRTAALFVRLLKSNGFRFVLFGALKRRSNRLLLVRFFQWVAKAENPEILEKKLSRISHSMMDVISYELGEILTLSFAHPMEKHSTPCYFAMSIHDPLLDFQTTHAELQSHFERVHLTRLYFPYHQAPEPLTFEQLNRDFRETTEAFIADMRLGVSWPG